MNLEREIELQKRYEIFRSILKFANRKINKQESEILINEVMGFKNGLRKSDMLNIDLITINYNNLMNFLIEIEEYHNQDIEFLEHIGGILNDDELEFKDRVKSSTEQISERLCHFKF